MDDRICKPDETTPVDGSKTPVRSVERCKEPDPRLMQATSQNNSLWNSPFIEAARRQTPPETLYTYQRSMSKALINTSTPFPSINITDAAAQILLMLRDGLSVSKLQPEERQTFIDVYGVDALNGYDSL